MGVGRISCRGAVCVGSLVQAVRAKARGEAFPPNPASQDPHRRVLTRKLKDEERRSAGSGPERHPARSFWRFVSTAGRTSQPVPAI